MSAIQAEDLTKDYGKGRGIFSLELSVKEGECFGFLGPNGAGKTTTIRHLTGLIKADAGRCRILGKDCFKESADIAQNLGYLPAELVFPFSMTGEAFLRFLMQMRRVDAHRRIRDLADLLELDMTQNIRRMSKGNRQKVGIIAALFHQPGVLILDEPTSGLDPLMQNRFLNLLQEEKKKGVTIFLSSHIFEEVERICDRAAMIREGRIIAREDIRTMKSRQRKECVLYFPDEEAVQSADFTGLTVKKQDGRRVILGIPEHLPEFLQRISTFPVADMETRTLSLEELFLQYYSEDGRKAE